MARVSRSEISRIARKLASLRKSHKGGRPKILRPCPKCEELYGARELREHIAQCNSKGDAGQP